MAFPAVLSYALSQNFIAKTFRTNAYVRATLMAYIAGQTMMDSGSDFVPGRPGAQMVFSGGTVGEAQKLNLRQCQAYSWSVQAFTPADGVVSPAYGSMPTNSAPTTTAESQVTALVNVPWTGVMRKQILIWHHDLDMAVEGKESDYNIGISSAAVQERAYAVAMQSLINLIAPMFWTGSPTTWNTNTMDQIAGFISICGTGIYAQSTRVAGSAMVSHTINATTGAGADDSLPIANDPVSLVNAINGPGANIISHGDPIDLVLTTYANYLVWKNAIMARGQVVQVVNEIPQMAKVGVKKDALQVDGRTTLTWDPYAPGSPNTTSAYGTVAACLSSKYHVFATHPKYNWTTTPLRNWKELAEGAKDAFGAYVEVKPLYACEDPSKQALVTNLV